MVLLASYELAGPRSNPGTGLGLGGTPLAAYVIYQGEVLDAERSLFNAELSYAQTQGVLFRALVNLYKSMGGGWVAQAEDLTKE